MKWNRKTFGFTLLSLGVSLFAADPIERAAQRNPGPTGPGQASSLSICGKELAALYRSGETPSLQEGVLQKGHFDGEQYAKNSELQYQWATAYIKKLQLKGNERILDIGCGDGRVSALIAKAVPQGSVVGIDVSDSMLLEAQKLLQNTHIKNLSFARQDAMGLEFEKEFDLVLSFSCFHWVANHLTALQKIEKSLKPGGRVFIYFYPDHGRERADDAIKTVVSSKKWSSYFAHFTNPFSLVTPAKFASQAESAKLVLKRMEVVALDEVFPTSRAFAAWITGWMPQLKILPQEKHKEFLDEIIASYLQKHPADAQGKIHYIDYWLEAEFIKSSLSK
ncbi:MAG: methyltransferase domain-containing protein [Chlamydiota bacterium]